MPSLVTATEKKSRSPKTPRTIDTAVPIKDADGNVVGTVTIPIYPDGTVDRHGVALYCGVSIRTIDDWVAGRKIPTQRRSARMLRFNLRDVTHALNKLTIRETF